MKPCDSRVTVGNGEKLEITGFGDVFIPACRGSVVEYITLHHVFLVPSLSCNLLSLAVLTGRGCRYTAESDELVVTKNNLVKLVGKRNHINNLM